MKGRLQSAGSSKAFRKLSAFNCTFFYLWNSANSYCYKGVAKHYAI